MHLLMGIGDTIDGRSRQISSHRRLAKALNLINARQTIDLPS